MSLSANEYLKRILLAPVYDVAVKTDLVKLDKLSANLGNEVWLKREDQQVVKSFKLRGAYNKLASLSDKQLQAGVVAASAGNHAQRSWRRQHSLLTVLLLSPLTSDSP